MFGFNSISEGRPTKIYKTSFVTEFGMFATLIKFKGQIQCKTYFSKLQN